MATATAIKEKEGTGNKTNSLLINKVKLNNDNTVDIWYKKSNDLSVEENYFKGKDAATDEFCRVFQETVNGFVGVIPALKKDSTKITMNAIKLDYGKSEFLERALYSVKYAFNDQNNAVINISTPLLPIYKEGMENTFTISGKDEEALHEVIEKAKAYLNGETRTKQLDIGLKIVK